MKKNRKLVDILATGFYSGKSPRMPGTCGSLAALVLHLILTSITPHLGTVLFSSLLAFAVALIAIDVCNDALDLKLYPGDDPQKIVIDEFAGAYIAVIGLASSIWGYLLAFVLFRFFDILKPFPIRKLEKLPKGLGIVADDLLAGVYACIIGNLIFTYLIP